MKKTINKNSETFCCTRIRLRMLLDEAGCELLAVCPNFYNPYYYVWIYKRSDKLTEIVDEFVKTINSI